MNIRITYIYNIVILIWNLDIEKVSESIEKICECIKVLSIEMEMLLTAQKTEIICIMSSNDIYAKNDLNSIHH
jgi:hypothetical protein